MARKQTIQQLINMYGGAKIKTAKIKIPKSKFKSPSLLNLGRPLIRIKK